MMLGRAGSSDGNIPTMGGPSSARSIPPLKRSVNETNASHESISLRNNSTNCSRAEAGVIDPTKVTRTALQNAASIAGLMLTTEAMVSEIPEPKQAAPAGHGGGMGDMY